jgi:hypothetical protein
VLVVAVLEQAEEQAQVLEQEPAEEQDLATVQVAVLTEIQVEAEGLQEVETLLPLIPHHLQIQENQLKVILYLGVGHLLS